MEQYTPGPWKVVGQHNSLQTTYRVVCPDKLMPLSDEARTPGTLQANAYLIAAAPDLLDALKAVINDKAGLFWEQKLDKANTAIAKATPPATGARG